MLICLPYVLRSLIVPFLYFGVQLTIVFDTLFAAEMDLFGVVRLAEPRMVRVGHRPLRVGESPILQATAGRVMGLNLEEEDSGEDAPPILNVAPVSVAGPSVRAPGAQPDAEKTTPESSESVEITKVVNASEGANRGEKRKEPMARDDDASSSRVRRRMSGTATSLSKEESDEEGVAHSDAEKDATEPLPSL